MASEKPAASHSNGPPARRRASIPWARSTLDRAGIAYQYVDLDLHPEAERKLRMVAGPALNTPVVYVDGDWLMAPTVRQLEDVFERHGVW